MRADMNYLISCTTITPATLSGIYRCAMGPLASGELCQRSVDDTSMQLVVYLAVLKPGSIGSYIITYRGPIFHLCIL